MGLKYFHARILLYTKQIISVLLHSNIFLELFYYYEQGYNIMDLGTFCAVSNPVIFSFPTS
jgi:hypothetical protein